MKYPVKHVLIFLFPIITALSAHAQLKIAVESGLVFDEYNDVRVPNGNVGQGTLFSLSDQFDANFPSSFIRAEISYTIAEKHTLQLTAAPLTVNYQNYQGESLNFANENFSGDNIDGRYEFNTYRFSYRYLLVDQPKFKFGIGATLLVRDARIAISQNGLEAEDTDLGFVPLLSFDFNYLASNRLTFLLKGDALASPQGRAEDIFAGITLNLINDDLWLKGGYRLIEGGADVNQVYNFALFHFADLGLVYQF